MEEEIKKLKERIEELEKRPQYVPYYPPIQIQPYIPQGFNRCFQCGAFYTGYHHCTFMNHQNYC